MGWRQPRISGDEYYEFVDMVIEAVKRRWPKALIQFEDFAQKNAMPFEKYRDKFVVSMMIFKEQQRFLLVV
jgi:malate dehydrogenase (oxaloacetate-decarboxylating)